MNFSDKISIKQTMTAQDENLDFIESTSVLELGKCVILPNNKAAQVQGADGQIYTYSYEIVMRTPKTVIPKENDVVLITKADGTIDKECRVIGFVTLKKRWLKLWLI